MIRKNVATYFLGNGNELYYNPFIVSKNDMWPVIEVEVLPKPEGELKIVGLIVCPSGKQIIVESIGNQIQIPLDGVAEVGVHQVELSLVGEGSKYTIPQKYVYEVVDSIFNPVPEYYISLDLNECGANVVDGQTIYMGDTLELVLRANDGFKFYSEKNPYIKNGNKVELFELNANGTVALLSTIVEGSIQVVGTAHPIPIPPDEVFVWTNYTNCIGNYNSMDKVFVGDIIDIKLEANTDCVFNESGWCYTGEKAYELKASVDKKTLTGKAVVGIDQVFITGTAVSPTTKEIQVNLNSENCVLNTPSDKSLVFPNEVVETRITANEGFLFDSENPPYVCQDGTTKQTLFLDGSKQTAIGEIVIVGPNFEIHGSAK